MNEARAGQQGTLARIRTKRGMRPRDVRDHRDTWAWLFGAVCPELAVGAAVVLPGVNVDAINIHLAEISRCVTQGAHAVLVLDGVGWHTSPRLRLRENISLLPLPRYAPDLNPSRTFGSSYVRTCSVTACGTATTLLWMPAATSGPR
ncbi:transposase [Roseomonas chloroacetimidivorans]|uniref:transposase n=1 Tax=Roseomonas chloroacetimidivorans TaxID=1766656 RepID=UPI003C7727EF